MRILLTGFEPFGGETINSSQETVKAVSCDEIDIVRRILPVSFKRSGKAVCELIDDTEPDVVIMLGQSGKTDCIKIERIAVIMMDTLLMRNPSLVTDHQLIFRQFQ